MSANFYNTFENSWHWESEGESGSSFSLKACFYGWILGFFLWKVMQMKAWLYSDKRSHRPLNLHTRTPQAESAVLSIMCCHRFATCKLLSVSGEKTEFKVKLAVKNKKVKKQKILQHFGRAGHQVCSKILLWRKKSWQKKEKDSGSWCFQWRQQKNHKHYFPAAVLKWF